MNPLVVEQTWDGIDAESMEDNEAHEQRITLLPELPPSACPCQVWMQLVPEFIFVFTLVISTRDLNTTDKL